MQVAIIALLISVINFGEYGQNTVNADSSLLEGVAQKDRTHVYESTSKNSNSLKSYEEGSILLYKPHSDNWYKAIVIKNGDSQTGYINANDVETATNNPASLKGIALKDRTHVYKEASRDSSSPRSYAKGSLLYYKEYTSEWYKAFIINNGKRETVYIHANDIETKVNDQNSLQGVALADRTHVYSRASRDSNSLRSYAQGKVLYYKTFTSNWYEAFIYRNGERQTVYIHRDDVDNLVNNQVTKEGIAKETTRVYSRASRNSSALKSYGTGSALIYKTFSSKWYEAIVFVNGQRKTGYIHHSDVDTKLDEQTSLRGIATKNRTAIHSGLSKESSTLKSYASGSVLMYRTLSENWHEAIVFNDGQRQTGYIHVNDVENAYSSQESLQGAATKKPTNIYSRASRDAKTLKSYSKNTTLLFKTFSDSWYEAIVYVNGERRTGYIHANDVDTSKRIEETTNYDQDFNAAVDKWMSKNPQIWADGGFKDATREEVIYYANPDNFDDHNASSFYQYLSLSKPAGLNAKELNNKILYNKGTLTGTGQSFVDAANRYDINEIYLLAHALHETGNGDSTLAKGVEYNGETVYNVYGIGAYDDCAVECGAEHAYENGWTTPEKAIIGGAQYIREDFIDRGQDTLYKMRWNPADPGVHQYATDVNWALGQTHRIAELYDLVDNYTLFFDIPEYTGDPSSSTGEVAKYPNQTTGETTASSLNFRSGPSTSDSVIGQLSNGTSIDVLGFASGQEVSGNDIWYQIKHNGNTGWVHSNHVELDNLLQVQTEEDPLNVRNEPNGDKIGSLPRESYANAVIDNGSLVKDNGWYKVHLPDSSETGWVSGDYIKEIK